MSKLKPLIDWSPRRYDKLSKNYDRFANWFFPIGKLGMEKVLENLDSGYVLDIACGTGTLLDAAQQKGLKCIGVDLSSGMLRETRRKNQSINLVQASFYALPFADKSLDYVVETNAVSGADIKPEQILLEMTRVGKNGGEILMGDYSRSEQKEFWYRLMETIGILFGDYPHDYKKLFNSIGHEVQIEDLGWGGMYLLIKVML